MCGIIGITNEHGFNIIPQLVSSLSLLTYRGYDSTGISTMTTSPPSSSKPGSGSLPLQSSGQPAQASFQTFKATGKLDNLIKLIQSDPSVLTNHSETTGIGHCRWATHGAVTNSNAHPHHSSQCDFSIVHNGIIENYNDLYQTHLAPLDYQLSSETDTEIIAGLLEVNMLGYIANKFNLPMVSTLSPKRNNSQRNSPQMSRINQNHSVKSSHTHDESKEFESECESPENNESNLESGKQFADISQFQSYIPILSSNDIIIILNSVTQLLHGSYALCILFRHHPSTIYATRKNSPLCFGQHVLSIGNDSSGDDSVALFKQTVVGSDASCIDYCENVYFLNNYEILVATPHNATVYHNVNSMLLPRAVTFSKNQYYTTENEIERKSFTSLPLYAGEGSESLLSSQDTAKRRALNDFYMLKEINEQSQLFKKVVESVIDPLRAQIMDYKFSFPLLYGDSGEESCKPIPQSDVSALLTNLEFFRFLSCGSSYHACLLGSYYLESIADIYTSVEIASEFIYRSPKLQPSHQNSGDDRMLTHAVLCCSQSGETSDTIQALNHCLQNTLTYKQSNDEGKPRKPFIFSLCNTQQSTISRSSHYNIAVGAGIERAVASTKAFTLQSLWLLLLSLYIRERKGLEKLSFQKASKTEQDNYNYASIYREMLTTLPFLLYTLQQHCDQINHVFAKLVLFPQREQQAQNPGDIPNGEYLDDLITKLHDEYSQQQSSEEKQYKQDPSSPITRPVSNILYNSNALFIPLVHTIKLLTAQSVKNIIIIGRGYNYPVALECGLKLKELTYLPTQAVAAGELKHGPLSLIDEDSSVTIALCPHNQWFSRTISNVQEVLSRKGKMVLITDELGMKKVETLLKSRIESNNDIGRNFVIFVLPNVHETLQPFLITVLFQYVTYFTTLYMGKDVDQPRNLAKCVSVE